MRKSVFNRFVAAAVATVSVALVACGPTDDERLARAASYVESADYHAAIIELSNVLQSQPGNVEARVLLAESAFKTGDYETSAQQYSRAIELGAADSGVAVAYARVLIESGEAEKLMDLLDSEIIVLPDNQYGHATQGDLYLALGNWEKADSLYRYAIEFDDDFVRAKVGLAMVDAGQNYLVKAIEQVELASIEHPDSCFVRIKLGDLYRITGKRAAAIVAYAHALELWTSHDPLAEKFAASYHLISLLIDSTRFPDAKLALEQFRSSFPNNPVASFLGGRLAFERGEYELAQLELQSYLAGNDSDGRGMAMLGAISLAQDNLRQAEIYLLEAVRANAGGAESRRLLAETRLRLERPEDALAVLQDMDFLAGSEARQQAMLGRAQIALGVLDQAILHFEKSLAESPDDSAVELALASAYVKSGRQEEAIAILETMPDEPRIRIRKETLIVAALASSGDADQALARAKELAEKMSDEPVALVVAGAVHQHFGRERSAISYFESALEVDTNSVGALYSLARIYNGLGDHDRARRNSKQLVESHPDFQPGMQLLTEVFADDSDRLQSFLAGLVAENPGMQLPRTTLAALYIDLGKPESALRVLSPLIADGTAGAPVFYFHALALEKTGELHAAIQNIKKAASMSPSSAGYQYTLARFSLESGSLETALSAARAYRNLRPENAEGALLLTEIARVSGSTRSVRNDLSEFLERSNHSPEASTVRGELALVDRDFDTAIAEFNSVVSKEPGWDNVVRLANAHRQAKTGREIDVVSSWLVANEDDASARLFYAQLLQESGELAASRENYELLQESGDLGLAGLNNLAWIYFNEDDGRAVELARQAYEIAPGNAAVMDTYGWILLHNGQADASLSLLNEAASILSGNQEVAYHLAVALYQTGDTDSAARLLNRILNAGNDFDSRPDAEALAARIGG